MRSIINALRKKCYPICADTNGYYYAQDLGELDNYIASLQGRINKEIEALVGLKEARLYMAGRETEGMRQDYKMPQEVVPKKLVQQLL